MAHETMTDEPDARGEFPLLWEPHDGRQRPHEFRRYHGGVVCAYAHCDSDELTAVGLTESDYREHPIHDVSLVNRLRYAVRRLLTTDVR